MWITRLFSHKEEEMPWMGFSLSQNHSCADYIFSFDVRRKENGRYYVTGEYRDAKGSLCAEDRGIRLKKPTVEALRHLRLEQLPEEIPQETEDLVLLDATTRSFSIQHPDGRNEPKIIPEEMFLDIVHRLEAYF